MRIYWPYRMKLPPAAYEVLIGLHQEERIQVSCESVIRWSDPHALAEYLLRHRNRQGWVYTFNNLPQVELAAMTGQPFRVLDFISFRTQEPLQVSAVVQVDHLTRELIWIHPRLKKDLPETSQPQIH